MTKTLNSRIPEGPVAEKWTNYKAHQRLVNPKNKLKLDVIVVGTGLAGASAAASLGEMGFNVYNFCIQDSPRRAHSIAAQGGINAAKNYQNDGDSVYRLFYDTVKGGDYRAREANVYRLAEVSNDIIDQCVAQGVPFAREYGGMLANRSFGGAQVSRTFYAKGQTGQQLLLGAYSSLSAQVATGKVKLYTRYEMEDVVIVDGHARGIIAKNLVTGKLERFTANAVVIATGGYGNAYFLSTNAMGCNCTAAIQCYRKGAYMANPSYVQIHPTCIPVHGDKSLCVMMAVSGFLRSSKMQRHCRQERRRDRIFQRKIVTITWSVVTQHSVTSYLVTLHHVLLRSVATMVSVLTTLVLLCSSTSLSLSTALVSIQFFSVMVTSSICMRRLQTLIQANSLMRLTA